MKKIVIINGSGGAGKDTFVEFCSHFTSVLNISSVDKIKDVARILGWSGEKDEKSRLFLSRLKFDSSDYNDYPYNYIKRNIENFNQWESPFNLMFIHIREPIEIERVKNDFNCKTLLIKNVNVKSIKSNEADANVDNYDYDYIIENNDDLKSLRGLAYDFIMNISLEENK